MEWKHGDEQNMNPNKTNPSPTDATLKCSPPKVSFAFNASLMQAATITPGIIMQEGMDDEDMVKVMGTKKQDVIHRTGMGQGHKKGKGSFQLADLGNTTMYDAFHPKVSPRSPVTKVSFEVRLGSNLVLVAQFSAQVFETLYGIGVDITPKVWVQTIGDQPAPFPLLAVQYPGNKVVLLHGL